MSEVMDSLRIQNEINGLRKRITSIAAEDAGGENSGENHVEMARLQGRIDALTDELTHALEAEDAQRARAMAAPGPRPSALSPIERLIGTQAEFTSLADLGERAVTITAEADGKTPAVTGLPDTRDLDRGIQPTRLGPIAFIDTLPRGVSDTKITEYPIAPAFAIDEAGSWTPHEQKAEHKTAAFEFGEARREVFAVFEVVSRDTEGDYPLIRTVTTQNLDNAMRNKVANAVLNGKNTSGMVGVLLKKHSGVFATTGDYHADILRMSNASAMRSGLYPNYVGMDPLTAQELKLETDANQRYMDYLRDGRAWSIPVVEDQFLFDVPTKPTKGRVLVYNSTAATLCECSSYDLKLNNRTEGYINDQFIRNLYTILYERAYKLIVRNPWSFVSMETSIEGATGASEMKEVETDGTAVEAVRAAAGTKVTTTAKAK